MTAFELNARLAGDTYAVKKLDLCAVRLMKDANYPWLVLIPQKADLIEIIDLSPEDRAVLMEEIAVTSQCLRDVAGCGKLNIGALGNQVSQLHIHVIGRNASDPAWPGPVWGAAPATKYDPADRDHLIASLYERLPFPT